MAVSVIRKSGTERDRGKPTSSHIIQVNKYKMVFFCSRRSRNGKEREAARNRPAIPDAGRYFNGYKRLSYFEGLEGMLQGNFSAFRNVKRRIQRFPWENCTEIWYTFFERAHLFRDNATLRPRGYVSCTRVYHSDQFMVWSGLHILVISQT